MKRVLFTSMLSIGSLLILVGSSTGNTIEPLIIGPYTQQSQFNSIVVSWMTTRPTLQDEVHWGRSPEFGNITVEMSCFPKIFHSVKIGGLATDFEYYYTVISDTIKSSRYRFWTACVQNNPIRCIVYGDSRGGWDDWQATALVSKAIEREDSMFVLGTGDFVDNGKNTEDWVDFFSVSSFIHNSTFYPVLGNHENYAHMYFFLFSLPSNERWYSFDNGPVHFVGLDSNQRNAYRLKQYLWLLRDLQTHNQSFSIVFFHHPLYSSGEHGNASLLQKIWAPVFERFHVDIVFNGHDHDYEHCFINGVTYIVTGGGGAPLYDVGHNSWTIYSEKTYHYCLLTVNSSTLKFEAKKPDGLVFDSFILTK